DILPVLIGLKSEKATPNNPLLIRLPEFCYLFVGDVPSMIIVYHPRDKLQLPKIFEEHIMDPVLISLTDSLLENEKQLVFQDGGCNEHLRPIIEPLYLSEMEKKNRVSTKTHV